MTNETDGFAMFCDGKFLFLFVVVGDMHASIPFIKL